MKSKLKIVDTNLELIKACKDKGYDAVCSDYFLEAFRTPNHVLCTASNPRWTFGGGIDALFADKFYGYCSWKQIKGGKMERIGNIIFAITVDETYKATPEMVTKALQFAIENTKKGEVLLVSCLGTGIGGLSKVEWLDCLDKAINDK